MSEQTIPPDIVELHQRAETWRRSWENHKKTREVLNDVIADTERVLARSSNDFREQDVAHFRSFRDVQELRTFHAECLRELATQDAKVDQLKVVLKSIGADSARLSTKYSLPPDVK